MAEASASEDYPRAGRAWLVVAVLFCTAVLSYTDRQVLSLIVDPVRADLRIDDTRMSLLLGAAFAVIYGVAGLPLGWLADRASRRNLILAGVGVWGLGTIGCGLARDFGELFCARLVVGLGEAALSPAAISLISDCFPPARRGRALGLFFTGISVGVGGGFFIGGAVLDWVRAGGVAFGPLAGLPPWRLVLLVLGLPSLAWCLVILTIREPRRQGVVPVDASTARPRESRAALLAIAPLFAAVALASLADNAVGAWAPSLLVRRFHLDPGAVGVRLGLLLTLGYGGGMLAGGWLADIMAARRGPRGKIELCALAAAGVLPVSWLFTLPSADAVLAGVVLYFALSALVTASGLSAIMDATPNRVRGRAAAVSFFFNVALGAGLGPTAVALSGRMLFGEAAGLGAPITFTAVASFLLAMSAAILALRRTRSR